MSNANLYEITCQKAVNGNSFREGLQNYNWSQSKPNCVNMSKSYFRVDFTIESTIEGVPEPLTIGNQIALAQNCCGNLYNNAYFKLAGADCCAITSYLPQASALWKRTGRALPWLSSIGAGVMGDTVSRAERVAMLSGNSVQIAGCEGKEKLDIVSPAVSEAKWAGTTITVQAGDGEGVSVVEGVDTSFVDGIYPFGSSVSAGDTLVVNGIPFPIIDVIDNETLNVAGFTTEIIAGATSWYIVKKNYQSSNLNKQRMFMLFQLPLGIFQADQLLGAGQYSLQCMPSSTFINDFVETANSGLWNSQDPNNRITLVINDVRLYLHQMKATVDDGPRSLSMTECAITSKPLQNGETTLQFSVPPSTKMLAVWIQSQRLGATPIIPPSMFKTPGTLAYKGWGDTSLQSIQLIYGNVTKPSTRWTSSFATNQPYTQDNRMVQRYYDTYGELDQASMPEGCETYSDWLQRGPYYLFRFDLDESARSTEVQLSINYSGVEQSATQNANVYLAALYSNQVQYMSSDGLISAVSSRQV